MKVFGFHSLETAMSTVEPVTGIQDLQAADRSFDATAHG
jgi:hypothetical protein